MPAFSVGVDVTLLLRTTTLSSTVNVSVLIEVVVPETVKSPVTVKFANVTEEGAQVIVRWDPKNPPKPGQTITVTANPAAVHLFNATTGERI